MTMLALFQNVVTVITDHPPPMQILALSEAFTLLFVVMGPPLKTPAIYYARMHAFDASTRRALAFKTFVLATVTVLVGGFVGLALQHKWQITLPAMLLAGGLIFLLVSLRTVLEQYAPDASAHLPPNGSAPAMPRAPTAFDLAIPMIVTPYGLAGFIVLLASSHSTERTIGLVIVVILVLVLHLLAMLSAGPIMRSMGADGAETRNLPTRWNSLIRTAGIGWDFRLAEHWVLRPIGNGSIGWVSSDVALGSRVVANRTDLDVDFLDRGTLRANGVGGSLMLDYERYEVAHEIDMEQRYTNIYPKSYGGTSPGVKGNSRHSFARAVSESSLLWRHDRRDDWSRG